MKFKIRRSEAFALLWFAIFPLMIFLDGDIVTKLGVFPNMSWDTALKYYYMALSGVEAIIILLYGYILQIENQN